MSILIITELPEIRLSLKALLENAGYPDLHFAGSAQDAELLLSRCAMGSSAGVPGLVLLERRLPDADGLALCRRIRSDNAFRDTAVLLLTARRDTSVLQAAFEAGAWDCLLKPFDGGELLARVGAALTRAQTTRELRLSEKRLRDITATLGEGLLVIDAEARISFMNAEAEQLLGWRETELAGRDVATLLDPDAGSGHAGSPEQCPIRQSVRIGIRYRAEEAVFFHKDGSPVVVAYRVNPLLEEGRLVGSVTVFRDLAEQRRHETDRSLAAKAIEFSPEGIVMTESEPPHAILKVNPAFTAITGYTTEELRGRSSHDLFNWRDDPHFYQQLLEAVLIHGEWRGEIWTQRKDGAIFPGWLRIAAIRDALGRATQYMAIFSDITRRKEAEQRLEYLANHDPLTGLPNRAWFNRQLQQFIDHARTMEQRVAVLFVDLDRFKPVNDQFGHAVGDQLLCQVAKRLLGCIRASDGVARLGGDEFVMALSGIGFHEVAGIRSVADKALAALAAPFRIQEQEILISASIGISLFPDDSGEAAELLEYADQALYRAKQDGRNGYQFHAGGAVRFSPPGGSQTP